MLYAILTICGGVVAASSLIVARKPNAKDLFDKVAPYQGALGLGLVAVGVLWLLRVLPHIGGLMAAAPLSGGLTVAAIALDLLIGFTLGFGLISKLLLAKNEPAKARGKEILAKLVPVQVPLGLAATAVGTLCVIGV